MEETVKMEAEEGNLNRTTSFEEENLKSVREEDVTLAQLSFSSPSSPPRPLASFSAGMERSEKRVKVKRRYSDSKTKHAITGHAGKCICCGKSKPAIDRLTNPGEVKSAAMIRAEEVQSNLESTYPSFVKSLVRSHVGSCFWMGLPGPFCRAHLPREDTVVFLEDECGKVMGMKYIGYKTGLSAGWRQFAVAHQLLEGDVLVFQLIGPCKFKVYIIRANDLAEVDGALGLLTLDPQIKQNDAEMATVACTSAKRKRPRSLPLAVVQKNNKKSSRSRLSVPKTGQLAEQSENDSEEVGSEVLEGFKLSLPAVQFEDVKSFENFNILVDGLVLDSELSEDIRRKYYKLCCSQNAFLHESLIKGINFKLIAGIISETVNIADAIRASNLTTSSDEFDTWDKTLNASEQFGMKVGFLRARLSQLVSLAFDSEGATKTRRYIEARTERVNTEDEIRNLEAKLEELKAANEKFGADIESLKLKAESYEIKFQEEVLAPW
ncbi:B3 domain-containing protein Os01g0234100 isoform X2 [Ricinus communis]|uniref:B3 domain-containing protein Os01g0234100 isoform X2 n=1 Tax=Ricinus communis TaxID=3988 RepID=UPI0007723A29|nr:B3 domain-containing protein Os01g0234100 isoform X2 [Ricinus communis]|eukprot:XP_015577526.1 B3 domain-containing protein Os01g0234100 isoform X2 [Ricinus communis]